MLLLLASKEQRSSSITARSMCGVHAAPRSMCGVAGCGIHTRRVSAAGDLHITEHSKQTANHNTTLQRNVEKTHQKYKYESALFSAFVRARRPEGRRTVRARLVLIDAWTYKPSHCRIDLPIFGSNPPKIKLIPPNLGQNACSVLL